MPLFPCLRCCRRKASPDADDASDDPAAHYTRPREHTVVHSQAPAAAAEYERAHPAEAQN
eukprot:NODE_6812_length_481_cov_173.253521.p3 GENE.NODE_6812_length_481_cov_173.253521~~NODE_6812_length_481_cov_173.253521.p3  ORF type:complete len:60 (-),score=4.22 NODE_6812_length_481_cov_173.253521:136-315(-)